MKIILKRYIEWLLKAVTIAGFIIALVTFYIYLTADIEKKIYKQISSHEFIKSVTNDILQIVIFNNEGTILFNKNADKYIYIDEIKIKQDIKKHDKKIIIKSKTFLTYPPILYSLEAPEYFDDAKRINGNTFIYKRINITKKIFGVDKPWEGEDYIEEIEQNKYKLEIIK